MQNQATKYTSYSIRGLPAGVWGESYAIVTAVELSSSELMAECFVLTKRPKEALHQSVLKIMVTTLPPELGTIDLDFALAEGKTQAELLLMDGLETRATELSRPDVAYLQFELKELPGLSLMSPWCRGLFNSQIVEIGRTTQCAALSRYISLLSQTSIITLPGQITLVN
ncbi:hypothetical protein [Pseudoduganella namucuonensis]|uniref:hypothetical protein n=1 Tax=Pseudoduganella namucuonensis TaxID=1035707 RepID=UPI001160D5CA|nr:hypothetical protein [Pseudoduganella namucuonensis]